MARSPRWVKIEHVGRTPSGNMGVRVVMRWWAVPWLVLVGCWKLLTGQYENVPDACDGLEHVETKIG
jgi:hypothetical protein